MLNDKAKWKLIFLQLKYRQRVAFVLSKKE